MGRRRPGAEPAAEIPVDTGTARIEADPAEPGLLTLYVNGVPSSQVALGDPARLEFEYMDWMARIIDAVLPAGPLRALHLGAGGCSMPRHLEAVRPGSRQIGVDLDAALLRLVRERFDLPRAPLLRLRAGDAAAELAGFPEGRFDLIIRDVFYHDRTPEPLRGETFYAQAARVLAPGGLLLANIGDAPPHDASREELRLAAGVFEHCGLAADPGQLRGRRRGNLVLAASRASGDGPDWFAVARALRGGPAQARLLAGHDDSLRRFVS
ncbi:spermidine synthase [Sediminivirga luteola]|uniref:Methyltransferase type 11 domain-containing protein n=1 Tax=Sediminivirga luteola TaxID=1774748 RepID=A0A8J2TZT4_9MICO|nr:fused MFS/spermidine synthase [Sediminivirga luteola]MCI2264301.1 fused MFS/spermidine synthase [Sediminivirga luteola]GGA20961.1 hypothetical protein GCM10011333_25080 [Sediminivirga luteola]